MTPTPGPCRFGWLVEGRLAGSGRPGRYAPLEEDLRFLRGQGIAAIVSLLETPANLEAYRREGFEAHHFPVEDFAAPSLEQIAAACRSIDAALARGRPVLVHCNAGIGRTGTILACYLVHTGARAEHAVRTVRAARPYSLESRAQEEAVARYERFLRGDEHGAGRPRAED